MPLKPETREELRRLYNALADRVLEPDDPVYVAQVNTHGTVDPIEEIATEIDWQEGGGVCLFTGQRGTGKSTELKRLQQQLTKLGVVVFYADLSEYLLLTKEVEISDFLISVAGAMSEQVQARFGKAPANRSYWDRLRDFLQTTVKVEEFTGKLGGDLGGIELKASLKNDPTFKKVVQEASRGHVARLVQEAHGFLTESVALVKAEMGDPNQKVVLILDSIERIRGVGSEAMSVYESVRDLFFGHAEHLRIPTLHMVYTVPPYLSVLAAGAGSLMGGAFARRLVSTHIFTARTRQPDEQGLAVLRAVVAARFAPWKHIFSESALDELAVNSGGDLREFFRLIRLCLPAVRDDGQLPLGLDGVGTAVRAARNEMLPIPHDHLAWLKCISQTHDTCLQRDADLPTLAHFLDNRLVLNYRNGDDWYDVHPLLRDVVDTHVIASA